MKGEIHASGYHCLSANKAVRAPGHACGANHEELRSHAWGRVFLFKPRVASRGGRKRRKKDVPIFPVQHPCKPPSRPSLDFIHPGRRVLHDFIDEVFSQFTNVYTSQSWDHQRRRGSHFSAEMSHGRGRKQPTNAESCRALPTFSREQDSVAQFGAFGRKVALLASIAAKKKAFQDLSVRLGPCCVAQDK